MRSNAWVPFAAFASGCGLFEGVEVGLRPPDHELVAVLTEPDGTRWVTGELPLLQVQRHTGTACSPATWYGLATGPEYYETDDDPPLPDGAPMVVGVWLASLDAGAMAMPEAEVPLAAPRLTWASAGASADLRVASGGIATLEAFTDTRLAFSIDGARACTWDNLDDVWACGQPGLITLDVTGIGLDEVVPSEVSDSAPVATTAGATDAAVCGAAEWVNTGPTATN